eukprot:746885-Hanusia_phi.AAC.5
MERKKPVCHFSWKPAALVLGPQDDATDIARVHQERSERHVREGMTGKGYLIVPPLMRRGWSNVSLPYLGLCAGSKTGSEGIKG